MTPLWVPRYRLTPAMARSLMEVGAAAAVVEHLAIPPVIREELRHRARVRSTHYFTRIEGNRLTLAEAEQAISASRVRFHGRERDATTATAGQPGCLPRSSSIAEGTGCKGCSPWKSTTPGTAPPTTALLPSTRSADSRTRSPSTADVPG